MELNGLANMTEAQSVQLGIAGIMIFIGIIGWFLRTNWTAQLKKQEEISVKLDKLDNNFTELKTNFDNSKEKIALLAETNKENFIFFEKEVDEIKKAMNTITERIVRLEAKTKI